MAICYIVWPFGIFVSIWSIILSFGIILPVLEFCNKKIWQSCLLLINVPVCFTNCKLQQSTAGWKEWTNFRPVRVCFLYAFVGNNRSSPNVWATLFPRVKYYALKWQKWVGLHLRQFFHELIWSS
jgi:hypothetical protein